MAARSWEEETTSKFLTLPARIVVRSAAAALRQPGDVLQNNKRLGQAVERTVSLVTNVATVGLAIQAALVRQKRIMEVSQRTKEFLGNRIVANALAIKRRTSEIGDVYNNPAIAIDNIAQAHNELMEAIQTADRLRQEGITGARENIVKLGEMASDVRQKASGLLEPATGSVEA